MVLLSLDFNDWTTAMREIQRRTPQTGKQHSKPVLSVRAIGNCQVHSRAYTPLKCLHPRGRSNRAWPLLLFFRSVPWKLSEDGDLWLIFP